MRCTICKEGETSLGFTTVTLSRDSSTIIFKNVPAEICDNCGEYYLSESVSQNLLNKAEMAIRNRAEVEILQYAA